MRQRYCESVVNGDAWSIRRLKHSDAVWRPDQIGAVEDVEQHDAIGDLTEPWNVELFCRAEAYLPHIGQTLGIGEAGPETCVKQGIESEQPIAPAIGNAPRDREQSGVIEHENNVNPYKRAHRDRN
jgi:hypothetical protein